jgi:membrane-associated protease RseP (regulator of RpoE activity)
MLGVYSQAVRLTNGQLAVQITSVIPGTAAARAQFDPGDIIVSANGYSMQSPDNIRWIVANSGGALNMLIINVRTGQYQQMYVPF